MSFYSGKKVLITGGAGFVGVNLTQRLLAAGADIRATFHNKPSVIQEKGVELVQGDLTDMDYCRAIVEGVDFVFHCAASTSGAAVIEKTPLVHVTPNIVMNARLLEASYHAGIKKFMWLGSSTGYPVGEDRPLREEEMMQGDPYEKYFCVGWMKRYTEVLCRMYAQKIKNPMLTIVLRPTNIYGPFDDFEFATSHVLPALIRRVVERHDPIEVWGTGDDIRDLIYIDDMVDAMVLSMEKLDHYDALNIALGKGYRVKEILNTIIQVDGYDDAKIVFDPSKPSTIPKRLVDTEKAKKVLGFKAKVDLKEGIEKTIQWYKCHTSQVTGHK